MRDKSSEEGLLSRAAAGHPIFTRGETAPVLFAPFATRHMHEFGTTREMLASVAVKNHYNGARDPYAHFQNEITVEDVMKSAPVCHPLHLLDCCPQTDGAAAVLLVSAERAREFTDKPVYVAGSAWRPTHPYLHEKDSFTEIKVTRMASQRAYAMAASAPPTSTARKCTTASPSPRSSTSKTSASSKRATVAARASKARPR